MPEKRRSKLAILLRAISLGLLVGDAVAASKAKLALESLQRRYGQWQTLPARQLIPVNMAVLTDDPLQVDQAALTAESLALKLKPP
jgi:ADP-ribosylglycohydrolase